MDTVNTKLKIKVCRLRAGARLPSRATPGSAALDVYSCLPPDIVIHIPPRKRMAIPTGLQLEIPPNYFISIRPRSGLALKTGLSLPNAPGTIDSDYRGELNILVVNLDEKETIEIQHEQRIAQLLLEKAYPFAWEEVGEPLSVQSTIRGNNGFGSTGLA